MCIISNVKGSGQCLAYDLIIIFSGFVGLSFVKLKLSISNHKLKSFSDHLSNKIQILANCDMDSKMMSYKLTYYIFGIIFVSLIHFHHSQQKLKNTVVFERYIAKILLEFHYHKTM